ncbi:MAG: L-serine ammonia-lyase, iron-sulfur-dependent, subunit alpha [Promethearchaeota archaeon]|jgi:L-serine dehydratase
MEKKSIFNDVIGPIMRGPSSSHTAAAYHIAQLVRMAIQDEFKKVEIIFNENSSWAQVYGMQNSEFAFIAGLIDYSIFSEDFFALKEIVKGKNISIEFQIQRIDEADHPNFVKLIIIDRNDKKLVITARSIGGGMIILDKINDWAVDITGEMYNLLIEYDEKQELNISKLIEDHLDFLQYNKVISRQVISNKVFKQIAQTDDFSEELINSLNELDINIWLLQPIFFVKNGEPIFITIDQMISLTEMTNYSLGNIALEYESKLLGLEKEDILKEMKKRINIMFATIENGFEKKLSKMKILEHSASTLYKNEQKGKLFSQSINTTCAIRALSAMDVVSSGGVICAAPTGGSAGVLPAVLYTLHKDYSIDMKKICYCALAAGAIGLINSYRSTFAAEVAGCQVEIGMAGAMACASIIEAADGSPVKAINAAAISLQNTMGSVCDLVAGLCEIPCHTRNAAVASSAFVCADLTLGGYINPIPLDETIDASLESGKMLPEELRCTALGGIANTKTARKFSL